MRFAEAIVTVQRDYGGRSNRKHARLKYLMADMVCFGRIEGKCKVLFVRRPFQLSSLGPRTGCRQTYPTHQKRANVGR